MKLMILVCVIAFALFEISSDAARSNSNTIPNTENILDQSQDEQIVRILTNKVLWRDDFPSLLRRLKSLNASGETKISVLPNEAYGERKFTSLEVVGETGELHSLMGELRSLMMGLPPLKPAVQAKLNATWNQSIDTVTAVGQPSGDDGSVRVNLTSKKPSTTNLIPTPEFLAPELTLSTVKQQNGEPEKVTTQIVDSEGEHRPEIVTLYHYAGGAIVFAVSDMSPTPLIIDRVILDTAKVSQALFADS